jgi:vitamin B12 transporter
MPFASISPAALRVAFARTSAPAHCTFLVIAAALTLNPCSFELSAQQLSAATSKTVPKTVHGVVHDPLGARVAGASVELLDGERVAASTSSGPDGEFQITFPKPGRYRIRVTSPSFQMTMTPAAYYQGQSEADVDVTLATKTLTQRVTVTATGTPTPEAQTGVSVTVISSDDFRYVPEIQDPLRLVPGVQVTQTGQMGGTTGLSIRGGDTDANRVLIDGIPANQIGGGVEFANLASVGIQSIEVLNEPGSVLYGSDAMAGVVNLTTTRAASTTLPLFSYAGDAGNFHTYRNEVTAGTVYRQFDLYSADAHIQTDNSIPNSEFDNGTYAGNFGWTPNASNDLRLTVRHINVSAGQSNAIALYGIPDDAQQKEQDLYVAGAWSNQTTPRWHNLIRYGYVRLNGQFNSFGATGIYDPNTGYYDGAPVTIRGANGYSVSGQALFQYSNVPSQYFEHNSDKSFHAQTDFRLTPHLLVLGAFKFESETGSAAYAGSPVTPIERGNYDYSLQFSGDVKNRLFYTFGTGLEDNGLFGFAATPRASLAYYLSRPSSKGVFTGTKLQGTFGKGIKEPSVYQQQNSLYGLLSGISDGGSLLSQFNVRPLGPEESRTFDAGLDQQFFNGRARAGVTYFHDEFTNRVEYVPQQGLIELGIPTANLSPIGQAGGAYLNSSSFRSQGVEFTSEVRFSNRLFARGGYTYTDAVIQRSFSSDNLGPSFNTSSNFSNVPIGAFSPLVGARPFRVAPHTGFFAISYTRPKFYSTLTGTLVSRRDDSDFLSDSNFGNSLLLPNRNLLGGYERVELGGGYQLTPRVNVYTNIQNLLSQHYYEAFGYPALPFTFRSGIKFNFGGESWSLK